MHGIGIHHAGILPRYKQLVEQLALERLIKFVVSTETIAAGINLPAKHGGVPVAAQVHQAAGAARSPSAEYHQMAGRAGRPQFDDKGLAITLAPERGGAARSRRSSRTRAKRPQVRRGQGQAKACTAARAAEAQKKGDVVWTPELHAQLVRGEPAELRSKTKITAEQVLAIGLPDLARSHRVGQRAGP